MAYSRLRVSLKYLGVGIIGIIVGATLTYWLEHEIWRAGALATYGMAMQADNAGKEDQTIFLLSQAIAEDQATTHR
jgi:hypothetical protein